jgi:hypothetical protein
MNPDAELDAWRAEWRGAGAESVASVGAARRADFRYRVLAVAEYAAAALLLAGSAGYAALAGDGTMWAWAATVWALTIPTLVGAVRMRRGLWRASDASVRGFVDLEIRRERHVLHSVRYGYQVLAVTVTVNAVWAIVTARTAVRAAVTIALATLALAAAVALGLAVYRRHARRGLAALEALAHGLDEPS